MAFYTQLFEVYKPSFKSNLFWNGLSLFPPALCINIIVNRKSGQWAQFAVVPDSYTSGWLLGMYYFKETIIMLTPQNDFYNL